MSVRTRASAPLEPPSADGDPDASERSERGAADKQEALYCWGGPGRMGEIGREPWNTPAYPDASEEALPRGEDGRRSVLLGASAIAHCFRSTHPTRRAAV